MGSHVALPRSRQSRTVPHLPQVIFYYWAMVGVFGRVVLDPAPAAAVSGSNADPIRTLGGPQQHKDRRWVLGGRRLRQYRVISLIWCCNWSNLRSKFRALQYGRGSKL